MAGATGFIGSHVVRGFLRAGYHVAAGCRVGSDRWRLPRQEPRLTQHTLNLIEVGKSDIWDCRPQWLINCAGYGVNPREADVRIAIEVNAISIRDLVFQSEKAGVQRMIHLGSAAEYGGHDAPVDEAAAPATHGTYATTKLAGSMIALQAGLAANIELCVARPFGCYGTGESDGKLVPDLLRALRDASPIDLGPGTAVRDYTFIIDVVAAIVGLAECEKPFAGEVLNIGSGVPLRIRDLGETLLRVTGGDPGLARWGALPPRANEIPCLVGNPAKLRALTGWRATTSLEDGLRKTAEGVWI